MQALAEVLGIEEPKDRLALISLARNGLPGKCIDSLAGAMDLPMTELCRLFRVSSQTLLRRRRQVLLNVRFTGRTLAIGKVVALAIEVFQDMETARCWLRSPCYLLNARPLDLLDTNVGSDLVMEAITAYGQTMHQGNR